MTATRIDPPVLTDRFKDAFRNHPAGVAVITAASAGAPVGLTASSVASVSAAPPILAFSLSSRLGSAGAVADAETIVVHLLSDANVELARTFARPGGERFTDPREWSWLPGGEPLLHGTAYALRCTVLSRTPVGGSLLIAAAVEEVVEAHDDAAPLVYHNRTFHRLSDTSELD